MDPNQPNQEPAPASQAQVEPAPAPAVNQVYTGMPKSRKPMLLTVGVILLVIAVSGGATAFVLTRSSGVPQPTPTPAVTTEDVKRALPDIDSSLKEVDVNIATTTAGLNDVQGDLTE